MRQQKKIVVEIDREGNCSVDGQGFVGPECKGFMKEIQDTIGETTSTKEKRPAKRQTNRNRNLQKGGR